MDSARGSCVTIRLRAGAKRCASPTAPSERPQHDHPDDHREQERPAQDHHEVPEVAAGAADLLLDRPQLATRGADLALERSEPTLPLRIELIEAMRQLRVEAFAAVGHERVLRGCDSRAYARPARRVNPAISPPSPRQWRGGQGVRTQPWRGGRG